MPISVQATKQQTPQIYLLSEEHKVILQEIINHRDRDGLHEWIRLAFGVSIPRSKICQDHDAPFDFVCDFLFDEFQTAIVLANRSGGKTYIFAILITIVTFLYPEIEVANVAAIESQAKRCYNYFSSYIDKEPFASNTDAKTMNKTKLLNGSSAEILVATMSGVNSPHPQIAFFDEIDLWLWPILQQAFSMAQSKGNVKSKTVLTSTRKFPNGPMQRMLDEAVAKGAKVYQWCIWEVMEPLPIKDKALMDKIYETFGNTLPKNIAKANAYYTWGDVIQKYLTLDSDTWASDWLCIKPGVEGIIYGSAYSDERNLLVGWDVREQKLGQFYLFEDFGFGKNHPDVVLFAWLAPDYSQLVVFDELYMDTQSTDEIIRSVTEKLAEYDLTINNVYWICDYHGLTEIADRRQRGAMILDKTEESEDYKVLNGIAMVRKLFESNLLKMTDKCVNFRGEILSYRRKKNLDGTFSIEPMKKDDHGCFVAGTQIQTEKGLKAIEDVKIGDFVLTQNGHRKVIDWAVTDTNAVTYTLVTRKGRRLIGTGNHPIFTPEGKVNLANLKPNQKVIATRSLDLIQLDTWLRLLIQQLKSLTENAITYVVDIFKEMGLGFIARYGNFTMGQSLKGFMSTMLTKIELITTSRIFNCCLKKPICYYTVRRWINRKQEKIGLNMLYPQQRSGISLRRRKPFIAGLVRKLGSIKSRLRKTVWFVAKNTKPLFLTAQSFVIQIAKPVLFEQDTVVEVFQNSRTDTVYNLTVETDHQYIANGILVSNCDALRYGTILLYPLLIGYLIAKMGVNDNPTDSTSDQGKSITSGLYGKSF